MTQPQLPPLVPSPSGDMTGQILIELGKISSSIAVMTEQLKAVPDHESRLRALERFRFSLMGAVVVISAAFSGIGVWVGTIITHH